MTVKRIQIVSIPVSDQEAAKQFYLDVLGFELIRDNAMGSDQRWVEVAPKGAETSMTLVTWLEGMPPGSLEGIVLETDDLDLTARTLSGRGLKLDTDQPQVSPWGQWLTFTDPDGNGFVLQENA